MTKPISLSTASHCLEIALRDFTYALKNTLQEETAASSFNFTAAVSGRVDGDASIEFSSYINFKDTAKGGNAYTVVEEALRRFGWEKRNAPLCLPNVAEPDLELIEDAPALPDEAYEEEARQRDEPF